MAQTGLFINATCCQTHMAWECSRVQADIIWGFVWTQTGNMRRCQKTLLKKITAAKKALNVAFVFENKLILSFGT